MRNKYNICDINQHRNIHWAWLRSLSDELKADHPLFDWLINCVILNHF